MKEGTREVGVEYRRTLGQRTDSLHEISGMKSQRKPRKKKFVAGLNQEKYTSNIHTGRH